jgi:ABC-type nitrate/sulfonate/bicarbonate transport system substrate-binding protein
VADQKQSGNDRPREHRRSCRRIRGKGGRSLIAVLALAALLASACGSAATSSKPAGTGTLKPLSLTVTLPWQAPAPLCCMMEEAAQEAGLFAKANLTVAFVHQTGSALPIQTLVAGRTDLAGAAAATGISAYANGASSIRFIGGVLNSNYQLTNIGFLFAGAKAIRTAADLKGKTIGLAESASPADPGYVEVSGLLAEAGLSPGDVKWAIIGNQPLRDSALLAGRIDFTTISILDVPTIEANPGYHVLDLRPGSSQFQGWQGCECWFTTTSVLSDPDKVQALQRYVTATLQMIRLLINSEPQFVRYATKFDPTFASETPAQQRYAWSFQREQYQANGDFNLKEMQQYLKQYYLKSINPGARGTLTSVTQFTSSKVIKPVLAKVGVDTSVRWDPPQYTP